jgi:hypothetical protein
MRPAAAFASVLLPPRAVGPSLVAASRSPPAAAATTYGEINTTSLLIRSVHFFKKKIVLSCGTFSNTTFVKAASHFDCSELSLMET